MRCLLSQNEKPSGIADLIVQLAASSALAAAAHRSRLRRDGGLEFLKSPTIAQPRINRGAGIVGQGIASASP